MWRDATRYQLNVAVDKHVMGQIPRARRMSLDYVGQPIPVYWVEISSTINAGGIEDFYSRVCTGCTYTRTSTQWPAVITISSVCLFVCLSAL